MYGQYSFYTLQFHHDFTISNHVHTVATVQFDLLINKGKYFLALNRNTVLIQLITIALVISRLQQTWPKMSMNFNGTGNELFR